MRHYCNTVKRVPAKPRGYIFGAKLTFPVPVGEDKNKKPIMRLAVLRVPAVMVRVVVEEPAEEKHWAKGLGDTERLAIACKLQIPGTDIDEMIFLDNQDRQTIFKITLGEGKPSLGLRQVPVKRLVYDPTICAFYKTELVESDKRHGDKYRVVMGA